MAPWARPSRASRGVGTGDLVGDRAIPNTNAVKRADLDLRAFALVVQEGLGIAGGSLRVGHRSGRVAEAVRASCSWWKEAKQVGVWMWQCKRSGNAVLGYLVEGNIQ